VAAHVAAADPHSQYLTAAEADAVYATTAQGAKADTAVQPGSLATVATSGAYSDLSGRPTLGTAAEQNVGTSAGNVVQLDGTGKLPAVDGSALTNLPLVSTTNAGLAPATGEPSGKYLKDDGTWATVEAGASPAGSGTEIQYRDDGALGAIPNSSVDGSTGAVTLARLILAANGAASTPPLGLTGTWFTGGTATTTKPAFLLEPAGTTSTNWSTSGTGLGVNAPSGFAGNLLDLQVGGTRFFGVSASGVLYSGKGLVGGSEEYLIQLGAVNTGIISRFNQIGFGISGLYVAAFSSTAALLRGNVDLINGTLRLQANDGGSQAVLARDAADTLAQRNGTNAQTTRVYNTFTSATNFERAKIEWASNILRIGTEKGAGGGTARDMELQTDGTTRITVKADGAILFSGIPTSNPNVAGQLWNDGGTLKISAG
jgi:hypothetical protein